MNFLFVQYHLYGQIFQHSHQHKKIQEGQSDKKKKTQKKAKENSIWWRSGHTLRSAWCVTMIHTQVHTWENKLDFIQPFFVRWHLYGEGSHHLRLQTLSWGRFFVRCSNHTSARTWLSEGLRSFSPLIFPIDNKARLRLLCLQNSITTMWAQL